MLKEILLKCKFKAWDVIHKVLVTPSHRLLQQPWVKHWISYRIKSITCLQRTYNKGFIKRTPYCALQSFCAIITVFFQLRVGTTSKVDAMSHKKTPMLSKSLIKRNNWNNVTNNEISNLQAKAFPPPLPNLLKEPETTSQEVLINSPSEPAVFHRWDGLGCGRSWIAVTPHTSARLQAAGSFSYRLPL